jgi:hypothetical protein
MDHSGLGLVLFVFLYFALIRWVLPRFGIKFG